MKQSEPHSGAKYKTLCITLKDEIDAGVYQYQEKLPSEKELGMRFGLSRQTVRNALDLLENEHYIIRRKGSGTFVDKEVRKRDRLVGVLLVSVAGYIDANVFNGIERTLKKEGYSILLELSHNRIVNETRFLNKMLESSISGLIVEGVRSSFPTCNDDLYARLAKHHIPVVFVHNGYSNVNGSCVVWEDRRVSYELTNRLIESGHRRIAGVFRFDEQQGIDRFLGYIDALKDHQIKIREYLIGWFNDTDEPEEVKRIDAYLHSFASSVVGRCTALICYNDLTATKIIAHYQKEGIQVPDQVAIASFDDSELAKIDNLQQIPSIPHPKEKMGDQAAELLLEYINNPSLYPDNRIIRML